jgi:hypothetical protein
MASIAFASVGKLIELLSTVTAGEEAYVRVVSLNRLALGVDPFHPTHIVDISNEVLVPCNQDEPPRHLEVSNPPLKRAAATSHNPHRRPIVQLPIEPCRAARLLIANRHQPESAQRRRRLAGMPLAGSSVICGLMPITASGSRVN